MTAPSWPGLGFDPAPGEPAGAGGLAQQLADTGRYLKETHAVLSSVREQRGTWTGEASKAFAEKLGALPRYLDDAQTSLSRAGGVLRDWEGRLGALQTRARDLESRALAARQQLVSAADAEVAARSNPDFGLVRQRFADADLPEAQRRVNAAQAALDQAVATTTTLRDSLEDLIRQGQALNAEHTSEAARTADGIRRADDGLAPPEPGWFEQGLDWVGEHLGDIGDVAGAISAVAGALALIPVLTPFAGPVALVAGGVALLAHGADMVANDKLGDPDAWVTLGGDAIGLIPGARVLGAAADGARVSLHTVEGLTPAVSAAREVGAAAVRTEFGEAGPIAGYLSRGLTPAIDRVLPFVTRTPGAVADPVVVAKSIEATVGVGSQVPTVNEWLNEDGDYSRSKDVASYVPIVNGGGNEALDRIAARAARVAAAAT